MSSTMPAQTGANAPGSTTFSRQRSIVPDVTKCPKAAHGTGILTDGDFSGAAYPGEYVTYGRSKKFAPDWTVTGQSIDLVGSYFDTPDKLCSIDLDGTPGPGGMTHDTFATVKNAKYTLTFLFSGNGDCAPNIKKMVVDAGGKSTTFLWDLKDGSAESGKYKRETWTFTAPTTSTELHIASDDPPGYCGPVVADIALAKAP